jgi:hypothetical protein
MSALIPMVFFVKIIFFAFDSAQAPRAVVSCGNGG